MAVASDALPRFSLLTGATGVYAHAQSDVINERLIECVKDEFTCEAWLQIRLEKRRDSRCHGCWWIHTSSWACGVTSDLHVILYCNGAWCVSKSSDDSVLPMRRWFHIAVSRQYDVCELLIDGERIALEFLQDPEQLCLPISRSTGFHLGWTPVPASSVTLLLHEVRIWSVNLSVTIIQKWLSTSVTAEHPNASQLFAHWTFNSGALTSLEYDLSGNGNDLVIENVIAQKWLSIVPHAFHQDTTGDVARLVIFQDAHDKRMTQFFVEFEVLPPLNSDSWTYQSVTVVLVLNFACYPNPNLTSIGKGAGFIHTLQAFVQKLPSTFQLAIYDTSSLVKGSPYVVLASTRLDENGKNHARKALEKVVVKTPIDAGALVHVIIESVRNVGLVEGKGHSVLSVVCVTETTLCDANHDLLDAVEGLQNKHSTATISMVQVGSTEKNAPCGMPEQIKMSPLVTLFTGCEGDFEWVLATILSRVGQVVLAGAELIIETIEDASFYFTNESSPVFHGLCVNSPKTHVVVAMGCCSDRLNLAGVAQFPVTSEANTPMVTLTLTYFSCDGRKHAARATIRAPEDTTNHYYIEFTRRNERLRISDDEGKLFEQRRALMRKKVTFVSEFVAQEIADADNAFKRINIMKEELWARRKWIADRSLRLFEELQLQHLENEATVAKRAFKSRTDVLQSAFTASSRGSDSRGGSRGGSRSKHNASSTYIRVHLEQQTDARGTIRNAIEDGNAESDEQQSFEQSLHKVSVKLSVQSKSLADHEAKIEDLFVSVRLAEAKGPVIMNDTRRAWVLRFHDMMKTKNEVIELTLTKEYLESTLRFQEEQLATQQEVDAEVQSTNSVLARFDKELSKRQKRALLCAKETVGSVIDEFETCERVEAAKRDLDRSRLLRTLTLTQDMYASCIYVCFPVNICQLEIAMKHRGRGFTNLIHGICGALRHFCDARSETPVCRRLSFGETFLWWGLEQQTSLSGDESTPQSHLDDRRLVQDASWVVIIVSFNALFSSTLAMSEVKATLTAARDKGKPIFHIQLETPHDGLEAFRSQWASRNASGSVNVPTVEREFLTWKQNLASFQALLSSVIVVETAAMPDVPDDCSHTLDKEWHYPCLECLWPALASSHQMHRDEDTTMYGQWFHDLVCRLGTWLDGLVSVSLQTAPRSYHLDPNAVSTLSRGWEAAQQDQVHQQSVRWNDASGRRTKEIQRQIGKLFKVYEEEARDLVTMRFKLLKRKQEVLDAMRTKLHQLLDERKLLETWVEKLEYEDDYSERGRQRNELEHMTSEELWQHIHEAELATLHLEALDDQPDEAPEDDIVNARNVLDVALRCCTRAILDLGRGNIENCLRSVTRTFKKKELANQIHFALAKCDDQRAQILRMERIFDQAEHICHTMHQQRDAFVNEDATMFYNASFLEIRTIPSATIHDIDQDQLRRLAADWDAHATFSATIQTEVLHAQIASTAAEEYRSKVQDAKSAFVELYSPTIVTNDKWDVSRSVAAVQYKDFCQFFSNEPAKTWESLLEMQLLMEKEALSDREVQRVWGHWKIRFIDAMTVSHHQRWSSQCAALLRSSQKRLDDVRCILADSLERQRTSEDAFRQSIADRETIAHRLGLLQRRLIETKQRQQTLLALVHTARKCYETSVGVMDRKLLNVKTDAMYKSWAHISEYHVGLVGNLFDWRSRCSQQLDTLEAEIKTCQEQFDGCDTIITCKRQEWLKDSNADHIASTTAEGHQQLAHQTLELILSLEKQRVFKLFRVLDPRGMWLTLPVLTMWHDSYMQEYQRQVVARKAGGKQPIVGRSDVDELLVQLSIARLDVIKQEKLRDTLQRKLHMFERMLEQQVERHHIVEIEAQVYRSLGLQLTERVVYLREQLHASNQSEYLEINEEDNSTVISSIDRRGAVQAVRASRDQILDMITSAQQDYLRLEAMACRISWRLREHIACEYRGNQAIADLKGELSQVEEYLHVLKAKDDELYHLGLQSEKAALAATKTADQVPTTSTMGLNTTVARAIGEFYARDQWFRNCLDQTTAVGERIKSLREVVASLVAIQQPSKRSVTVDGDEGFLASGPSVHENKNGDGDEQLILVNHELRNAELLLLFNRFESRRAEKTSELLKEAITRRFECGDGNTDDDSHLTVCGDLRDVDSVLSSEKIESQTFGTDVYVNGREQMLVLLREHTTSFDPRDVAGNLSEVIFGASLDRNELKRMFLLQSKTHVEEQWGIAIVVLFFARLFRRASLRKAATFRCLQASVFTCDKLERARDRQLAAQAVVALVNSHTIGNRLVLNSTISWLRDLLEWLTIDVPSSSSLGQLQRVALGILMDQPLHYSLASVMPDAAHPIRIVADELEEHRAREEHQPPKPTMLRVFLKDRHMIKIEWKPITMDHDFLYVAEISEHHANVDKSLSRFWTQFLTAEKTSHSFYNLLPDHSYWVRVRSGFSRTRLGAPTAPLLVTTLGEAEPLQSLH